MTARPGADANAPEAERADDVARHSPLSFGPLAGIVGFHIARASVTAYEAFERCIGKPFDLKKAEFSLLMLVQANPGIPPKRLARALAVTAPKLTLLLDGLQQRKLIQRERNPNDGRSQHVMLTEPGRKLARSAAAAAALMEAELRSPMTAAEHAMLIELLGKLARRPLP